MEIKCCRCDKVLGNEETDLIHSLCLKFSWVDDEPNRISLGKYKPGEYHICYECLLSALGVPLEVINITN
jgi:hypothetical protein